MYGEKPTTKFWELSTFARATHQPPDDDDLITYIDKVLSTYPETCGGRLRLGKYNVITLWTVI